MPRRLTALTTRQSSTAGTVNNTLATRPQIFQSQVYAWNKYLSGGTFWNLKYLDNDTITSGEGYNASFFILRTTERQELTLGTSATTGRTIT